jgi:cellulose synthase (UDP-forming)
VQWPILRIFLFYLGLTVASVLWAFAVDDSRPLAAASGMALVWSWYNIILLTLACFVCIEVSQRRGGERFSSGELAILTAGGETLYLRASDISVSGMRLIGKAPAPVGTSIAIRFNALEMGATISRHYPDSFAVQFQSSQQVRVSLVRHIYCGSYSAAVGAIRPAGVATAVVSRLFR